MNIERMSIPEMQDMKQNIEAYDKAEFQRICSLSGAKATYKTHNFLSRSTTLPEGKMQKTFIDCNEY